MKKYKGFKKFYVHGMSKVCLFLVFSAIIAAIAVLVIIYAETLFFDEETGFNTPGMIFILAFLFSLSLLIALGALLFSISKIYVSGTEIIISYLKRENNGRYQRNELKEIFLGDSVVVYRGRYSSTPILIPHMVLCFGGDTKKRRSLFVETVTHDVYVQFCNSNLNINAVSLTLDEKLLAEIRKDFDGEIIEGVKPALR